MSTGLTPAACTRTSTVSGPTGGSGRSSRRVSTSGPPNSSYATPRTSAVPSRTARRPSRYRGAVHEHLALATRGVVRPGALRVLGDVHVLQPHLAVVDGGEAVDERGTAGAQALHLGAGEHQAHLVGVEDRVVVPRLLVLGDELPPLFTRHAPSLRRARNSDGPRPGRSRAVADGRPRSGGSPPT